MKRLAFILCSVLAAACATGSGPVRSSAGEWFVTSGLGSRINIHQTALGLAGRLVTAEGEVFPVRSIARTGARLSFVIPGTNGSYTATRSGRGWSGDWDDVLGPRGIGLAPSVAPAGSQKWVALPDGRQMMLDCVGAGAPAVIFDAGAGNDSRAWQAVRDEVGKTTQACAYDRAGLGFSDPGPMPRDATAVANDLDAMLKAANIPGPYVLVGHSLGSYHVRQFANTRFDAMAGLVLVDPSGDGQDARFSKAIPHAVALANAQFDKMHALNCVARLREKLVADIDPLARDCQFNDADKVEAYLSEVDAMEGASTAALTKSRRSWGSLPVIVLTRSDYDKGMPPGITPSERDAMKAIWIDMHEEMTRLSTAGQHRTVANAGHGIQRDQPQAVIDAIREVVTAARARKPN